MKNRQLISLALALGAGAMFAAPLTALADAPSHFAPTEAGVVYHPSANVGTPKTDAQAAAELAAARSQREWAPLFRWGVLTAAPKTGPAKSREEVLAELRAAQQQPDWDIVSRLGERR